MTMDAETFGSFLWIMTLVAALVFIALYFVKAGYGMFRSAAWGLSVNNKLAWMLMDVVVFRPSFLTRATDFFLFLSTSLFSAFVCFSLFIARKRPNAGCYPFDGSSF